MPTLLLVRHGRSTANAAGVLAGWSPGVMLDDVGLAQARALGQALAPLPLAAIVASPLERCQRTAAEIAAVPGPATRGSGRAGRPPVTVEPRIGETRYGDWTGRPLKVLAKEPLWRAVQAHPSSVVFPGAEGESMLAMQQRLVTAVREHDARVAREAGPDAVWVAVSHGDPIAAVLADALGMHLDTFQRIVVDPCSVSVVRYTPLRPFVVKVNGTGAELASLVPKVRRRRGRHSSDAEVGGGAGAPT